MLAPPISVTAAQWSFGVSGRAYLLPAMLISMSQAFYDINIYSISSTTAPFYTEKLLVSMRLVLQFGIIRVNCKNAKKIQQKIKLELFDNSV